MDNCDCMENSHRCCCGEGHSHIELTGDGGSCCGHLDSSSHHQHDCCHSGGHHEHQDFDKDYHEHRYHQLLQDREEMERNYERERRERKATEEKFQRENRERAMYEEKLVDLNCKLGRYDDDLNLLRNENGFLKNQFDSLRNVINSRVSFESSSFSAPDVTSFQSDSDSVNTESYKHEISVLANENELFKQIIDIINNQAPEESFSEKYTFEGNWRTDPEVTRLQDDNSKLKSQVREVQRNHRELESQLEQVNLDLDNKTRKMKKDISHLEEELHSKSVYCEDLERQLFQVSSEYQEEMQKMEIKIESEVLKKTQMQEEINVFENTVHRLELERIDMVAKLDELYNSENEIILARNELEGRFSTEMNELQIRLEDEIRSKIELSQEMTLLMNEFVDLRNKSNQMEEVYASEIAGLRLNLGAVMGDGAIIQGGGNSMATSNTLSSMQHQNNNNAMVTGQRLPESSGVRQAGNDIQNQLNNEIQKREALERENKDLLYKMKNILSNADPDANDNVEQQSKQYSQYTSVSSNDTVSKSDNSSDVTRKIRTLENKVAELSDECESLRRSAKKRKETENKNHELMDELEELSSERDGMLRKHKTLVNEVDKSSSSLQDLADRNRKLINEIDTSSRRIRDMEDSFRQERNNLIRSYDREKSLDMSDFKRKMEGLEEQLKVQRRENKMLEDKIRGLEDEIDQLKAGQTDHRSSQIVDRGTNRRSVEDSYSGSSNYSKPNTSYSSTTILTAAGTPDNAKDLKRKTTELEKALEGRENDHLSNLEEQRRQLRDEFDKEKQALRQCFEEEKRNLFNSVSGNVGPQSGQVTNVMNTAPHQFSRGTSNVPGNIIPQSGQFGQTVPQMSSQQPLTSHQITHPQNSFQSGTTQQPYTSPQSVAGPQAQYTNYTTGQSSGIPVVQQGVDQMTSFQGPQQPAQFTQQSHFPQQGVVPQNNQSPIYPTALPGGNKEISQLNETINKLQQEVDRLNMDKQNMGKRMKDLEGRMGYSSGKVNVRTDKQTRDQGSRSGGGQTLGVHFEVNDASRPQNDYNRGRSETQGVYTSPSSSDDRQSGQEIFRVEFGENDPLEKSYGNDYNLDTKLQVTMKKLVDEHRQHSDELRKQITLQKDSFEKEKSAMSKDYHKLSATIKCLKKDIHVLKHEREGLLQKLQRERRDSMRREERMKDEITTIKNEYEVKLKQGNDKSTRVVQDLHKKISVSESKVKEIEMKFRNEVTLIEQKYAQERIHLESKVRETEYQVKSKLEFHYQAKLKGENEKFETTLRDLRKEIQCLQDQRKEIQLKLSQDASSGRITIQKDTTYSSTTENAALYKRLQKEFENRYTQEKRLLEDTVRDLQREIKELEKEKGDIKASFKEEKMEIEEQFQREKRRIEERYRRERDELKRSLDVLQFNDQKFISMGGVSIIYLHNNFPESRTSSNSGMGDRKVRFDVDSHAVGHLRRSLSYTDLRNVGDTHSNTIGLSARDYNSSSKGLSRDDLGISTSRLGSRSFDYQMGHNQRNISNNQGSTLGVSAGTIGSGFIGNEARYMGITHIPSTGIINGGIGLAGKGAGLSLSGRNIGFGDGMIGRRGSTSGVLSGNSIGLNSGMLIGGGSSSAMRSGYSGGLSSGFLSGSGGGMGSGMMSGGCGGLCPGILFARSAGMGSGMVGMGSGMVGMGSGMAGISGGGLSSRILTGNGCGMGSGMVGMGSGMVGMGSGMAGISGGGVGSRTLTGNGCGMGSGMVGMGSGMAGICGGGSCSRILTGNGSGMGSGMVGMGSGMAGICGGGSCSRILTGNGSGMGSGMVGMGSGMTDISGGGSCSRIFTGNGSGMGSDMVGMGSGM
ncbi:hypothetical protein QZH41_012367, partial [Actinostola sp. cb2023]